MKSNFQNRMYDHEVTPPAESWKKIADVLDQTEQTNSLSSKLYHLEVTPAVSAWEKIQTSLDTIHETEAPVRKIFSPFFKYAAASVIIGLISWGAISFFNTNSGKKEIAKEKNTTPVNEFAVSAKEDSSATTQQSKDDAALEESKHTMAKIDVPFIKRLNNYKTTPADLINTYIDHNDQGINYRDILESSVTNAETGISTADRYISLMTPDGNIIRMSKKWADMVCCVSGADQDTDCKDQLQKWREQIACSPLVPSPGNFMDILSLVSSLQNN